MRSQPRDTSLYEWLSITFLIIFKGVIDATKTKNSCIQRKPGESMISSIGNLTYSEDCLFINVWSQSKKSHSSKLKPVMFWIHGGGLDIGSIFQTVFNGSVLATNGVVFVSVNYRLGPFGFLYGQDPTAPGNVGFYDQNLGLKWVSSLTLLKLFHFEFSKKIFFA